MTTPSKNDQNTMNELNQYGFVNSKKIADSLQGSIWCTEASDKKFIVKVTSKKLHEQSCTIQNGKVYIVRENVKKEGSILKYLTSQKDSADTIVKYIDLFETNTNYYLVMEHGGRPLFDFVVQAHELIAVNKLSIVEWHKCVNEIFRQLLNTVKYIHEKNIAHFDISLENIVINDVDIMVDERTGYISFCVDSIKIRLIDFGLSEQLTNKSKSSKFVGKANYKSPEVTSKQPFDPFANDIWCCCVCLFMMVIGSSPFNTSSKHDSAFQCIINNKIVDLINGWSKLNYTNQYIIDIFQSVFQYENKRISLQNLMNHPWLNVINY